MSYFKNERRGKFGDFESGIKLFEKVNSVYMKLEEKKDQNAFKSNLTEINRRAQKFKIKY